jgi:hypothetical protein
MSITVFDFAWAGVDDECQHVKDEYGSFRAVEYAIWEMPDDWGGDDDDWSRNANHLGLYDIAEGELPSDVAICPQGCGYLLHGDDARRYWSHVVELVNLARSRQDRRFTYQRNKAG